MKSRAGMASMMWWLDHHRPSSCEDQEEEEEEEEEAVYEKQMVEAMALSAAGDALVPSLALLARAKAKPGSLVLKPKLYAWDGVVHEWVSAPPVLLGATPEQETAYLEH
ncbi:Pre-mRNA-processing factor 39 [Hordeum vulgare]|nr:Pre-mRNA-processing factor 39 [Hordeum vulgare]